MNTKKLINEFKLTIDSKSVNEAFARVAVSAFVTPLDPTLEEIADLKTAVSEAVTNCIVHAYKDTYGKIFISGKLFDDNTVKIVIRDKGCGIVDVSQAMTPLFTTGEGDRAGLGFTVMESFCDKINVKSKLTFGTTVTLSKNIGLVHSIANRFKGRGVDYDDLFQSGCVGLIKAVDNFDESRGFAFSTYAVPVIMGEIKRIFRDGGAVKVSRSLKEKAIKAQSLREKFINDKMREPTVSELSSLFDCPPEEIPEILGVIAPMVSLSTSSDDGEYTIDVPVDESDEIFNRLTVHRLFKFLDDTEKAIVDMRYYKGFTQAKTAAALGISQVQVSRKEKSLLQKLRKYVE